VRAAAGRPPTPPETIAAIVVETIVDPATPPVTDPPPDWGALGLGMRTPAD